NPDGSVDHYAKLGPEAFGPVTQGWFDGFGTSVACLGDLDGDGVADLAAGSPTDSESGDETGAVWVGFLQADGTLKAHTKITAGLAGFSGSIPAKAHFGRSVGSVGDLDGDGHSELAVGAPLADAGRGRVWLLSLAGNGTVLGQDQFGDGLGGFTGALDAGDHFGHAVSALGDLNGDDVLDLAVAAPSDDDGASGAGAVWLLLLAADGSAGAQLKLSQTEGGFVGPIQAGDDFGSSLGLVEAYGPGGTARLAVGAAGADDGGNSHGALWVLTLQGPPGVSDPEKPNPYPPVAGSFDGVPGRPVLILVPIVGPGDELTDDPLTVTPSTGSSQIRASTVQTAPSGDMGTNEASSYDTGEGPTQAATADFNDDGSQDVVTANKPAGSFSFLSGGFAADAADLVFSAPVHFPLPQDGEPVALVVADFDLDTDPDLAIAGNAGVSVFRNRDLFTADFELADFEPVAFLTDLAAGDVNGDGRPDIVTASGKPADGPGQETGFASVLLGNGNGTLSAAGTFASGRAVASVLLGELDGGVGLDALLAMHALDDGPGGLPQGTLALFSGNGAGAFAPATAPWTVDGQVTGLAGFASPQSQGIHPRFGA
ncbi:MAG TPA: FG-GAP-like repeat-containing protein, partial [Planctomycetota bacterium]|nr:FG-GAP-like repeat-containing protein [Planctomycetota bacterium]